MKFLVLFKKELREILTVSTIVGVLASMLIFLLLGQVMSGVTQDMSSKAQAVVVSDADQSDLSRQSLSMLEQAGFTVSTVPYGSDDAVLNAAAEKGHNSVLIIPEGFSAGIAQGKTQTLRILSALNSFSMLSGSDYSASAAAQTLTQSLSALLIAEHSKTADTAFLQAPISTSETSVANGASAQIGADALRALSMQQSIFIPIIVFLLIIYASQLNVAAIANEKGDKTLETLLSCPVSRLSVLASKMCASGVLSILMAGVYMIGFSAFMGGITGSMGQASEDTFSAAMQSLGLTLSPVQYLLIGIQLFLTVLIALAISMVLGALAKDLKSASSMIAPLVFLTIIPYLVTMMVDIASLPTVVQIILYLIPFTHTFIASSNLMFGNTLLFYGGMLYQVVVLAVVMLVAVRIFSTDRIFTMTLDFSKRRKSKSAANTDT